MLGCMAVKKDIKCSVISSLGYSNIGVKVAEHVLDIIIHYVITLRFHPPTVFRWLAASKHCALLVLQIKSS